MVEDTGGKSGNAAPRRRGPKGKNPEEGRRISHSIRLKPSIAAKLRDQAAANHRSLGEEMEYRINKSFEGVFYQPQGDVLDKLLSAAGDNFRTLEDEVARTIQVGVSKATGLEDGSLDDLVAYLQGVFKRDVIACIRRNALEGVIDRLEREDDSNYISAARIFVSHTAYQTREVAGYIDRLSSILDPDQQKRIREESERLFDDLVHERSKPA